MKICPCGSNISYQNCCEPFLLHQQNPLTPLALMRSRYTAYSKANIDYIIETMKGEAAKNFDPVAAKKWAKRVVWLGLEIIATDIQGHKGTVEFVASFAENGKKEKIHEVSEFEIDQDKWFYIHGQSKP